MALTHNNLLLAPLLVRVPPFVVQLLTKSAERYEQNNNPTLRVSAALMVKVGRLNGNGKHKKNETFNWDREYLQAEAGLSRIEQDVNAALRLFFFLIENPSQLPVFDSTKVAPNRVKKQARNKQLLQSHDDVLTSEQFAMLNVAWKLLDSDRDGFVSYRDLRCATTTVPEFYACQKEELDRIVAHISIAKLSDRHSPLHRFSFPEWIAFIRHRLFLCDLTHHQLGPGEEEDEEVGDGEVGQESTAQKRKTKRKNTNDVQAYGIELRKLRGQLESALKIRNMKSKEFDRSNSMVDSVSQLSDPSSPSSPPSLASASSQSKLDQLKRHELRMTNKAIAISVSITNTEMAMWNAKVPAGFECNIAQRLGEMESGSEESSGTDEVLSGNIRSLIAVCLGQTVDQRVGNLMLEAMQGGSHRKVTVKSLKHCFVLVNATGVKLINRSTRSGQGGGGDVEVEGEGEGEGDPTMHNGGRLYDDDDEERDGKGFNSPAMSPASKNRKHRLTAPHTLPKRQQTLPVGQLGKEKQLLSFVSRGLMPHVY